MRSRKVLSGDLYHHTHQISVDYEKLLLNRQATPSAYDWENAPHIWKIVLARVEACLNTRPLYAISFDLKDLDLS